MNYRLLTTYYNERRLVRRRELEFCLSVNVSAFDEVVVISEGVDCLSWFPGYWQTIDRRPTHDNVLDLARRLTHSPDDINVVANCDIVLPRDSLQLLGGHLEPQQAYCLSRTELGGREALQQPPEDYYSHDAWCFRGAPSEAVKAPFWFGVPGCERRFAWELRAAGYAVSNPGRSIHSFHVHATMQRTSTNREPHRVPPPYLYLSPIHLGQFQEVQEVRTMQERKRVKGGQRTGRA